MYLVFIALNKWGTLFDIQLNEKHTKKWEFI